MRTLNSLLIALTFLPLFSLTACGPSLQLSVPKEKIMIQTVAVLPVESPSDVRRERVSYLRSTLLSDLGASGFIVLEDSIVQRICSTPECPQRSELVTRYGVDGFVKLKISSIYRANVIAGYVNTISGEAALIDRSNSVVATVTGTENEKGGLLFNSGQVFQGLKSTVDNLENTGDDGFNRLAERFVKGLVAKLPTPPGKEVSEATEVHITAVDVRGLEEGRFEVCVNGTPNSLATLLINRTRSTLRAINPSRYCGAYLLSGLIQPNTKVTAELRSAYGNSVQKDLPVEPFLICDPTGVVKSVAGGRLAVSCDSSEQSCRERLPQCKKAKLWVYRSEGTAGPFRKAGFILPDKGWSGPVQTTPLVILAESPNGGSSNPVELLSK